MTSLMLNNRHLNFIVEVALVTSIASTSVASNSVASTSVALATFIALTTSVALATSVASNFVANQPEPIAQSIANHGERRSSTSKD